MELAQVILRFPNKLCYQKIKRENPSADFIIKKIKTKGDILLNKDLNKILDKGFFVSEIQNELEKRTTILLPTV